MKNGVISVGVLQTQSIHHPHQPRKSSLEKGALEGQCRVGQEECVAVVSSPTLETKAAIVVVEAAMAEDNADVAETPISSPRVEEAKT